MMVPRHNRGGVGSLEFKWVSDHAKKQSQVSEHQKSNVRTCLFFDYKFSVEHKMYVAKG